MQVAEVATKGETHSSHKRVEDIRLLRGQGVFVDDLKLHKMAFLGIIRSPYPHAEIKRIDFTKARESADFIEGITGEDISSITAPIFAIPGAKETNRRQLAIGRTRYVGEPVAAFLAKNRYSIEDIIEAVEVEYKELEPVTTIEDSKNSQIRVYEHWEDNTFFRTVAKKGDASRAISASKHIINARIGIRRQGGVPIEPRSYIVEYDKSSDILTVGATVQSAHRLQNYLAAELRIQPSNIHVIVRDVGGGFGTKGAQSYSEPLLACILAKKTGYAVKATTTRTEDLLETAAGRDEYCEIELACDENARISGLKAKIEADVGVSGTLSTVVGNSVQLLPNTYKIPNFEIEAVCYVTNKAPIGPVRGAGRPEGIFFIERAMDIMAHHLLIDPLELRLRNLVSQEEMPYRNGTGAVYDTGDFPQLLEKLSSVTTEMRKWRDRINRSDSKEIAGVGVCMEVEDTGGNPKETAKISIDENGKVIVLTGSSPHGQGLETTLAQLCSTELGVPMEDIVVRYGDTNLIPFGIGTFGSRSISTGGSAVVYVSRNAREKIAARTSELSGIEAESIIIENGQIFRKEISNGRVTKTFLMGLASLIKKTSPIEIFADYSNRGVPYASGAHACALTIDKESGLVKIHKYVVADDCGVAVNPMIVEGQLHGGVLHGIGGSTLEKIPYSKEGQPLATNFLDYTMPSAIEIPSVMETIHVETPSTVTLSGAKGVGESGTIAAYPCVFNALNDGIFQAGSQIELNIAPAFPEDIVNVIHSAHPSAKF